MNLRELLKDKLSEEELKFVPRSFDIIGSRGKAVAMLKAF
jgi:tRNA G37 N-methylase Trm5